MNIPPVLLHYLVEFLEKPHPAFGALPPCPFARKERLAQRVMAAQWSLSLDNQQDSLLEFIRSLDANPQYSTLLIYDEEYTIDHDEIEELSAQLMCSLSDIEMLIIPLHPEAPFAPAEVHTRKAPFPTLVIQRHVLLSDAQVTLLKTSYYDKITEYDERMVLITNHQCTSSGIFFPAYWWSEESLTQYTQTEEWPEEIIGETILAQSSNQIHLWMHRYGDQFGWIPFGDFSSLEHAQQRIPLGGVFLATAYHEESYGHVELLSTDKPRKQFHMFQDKPNTIWQYIVPK